MTKPGPVTFPAAWRGADMKATPQKWLRELTADQVVELVQLATLIEKEGRRAQEIPSGQYQLPMLKSALEEWRKLLTQESGVVLVRGLPVRRIGKSRAAIIYWLIGLHLGQPVPQNADGETLVSIKDTGEKATNHNTRLYKTRSRLTFHTDGADIIGLLCLRESKRGGESRICSSVEVYNQIFHRRPDLVPLLELSYHHHAHGQFGSDGPPTFEYPIVTREQGIFRMMLLIWYIRNAAEDFPELASLKPEQEELLDLLESLPEEDGIALDMQFQEGDMQFLKNSVILHARSEYEDWEDPEEKRHLLRLWLADRNLRDGDDRLRGGFGNHRKLPDRAD